MWVGEWVGKSVGRGGETAKEIGERGEKERESYV